MSKIFINGSCIEMEGPLSMRNGKWYDGLGNEIDMNNLEGVKDAKTINITIEGSIDRLNIDHCNTITVNGNVRKVDTGSGNVSCKVIEGDADTGSGSIHCDTIMGDADTGSGSIHANKIGGTAKTGSGSVYENGVKQSNSASRSCNTEINIGGIVNNGIRCSSSGIVMGEVISGGFTMTKTADGKKHMTISKSCTVNGRRISDMSESELREWIDSMAKRNKIITII